MSQILLDNLTFAYEGAYYNVFENVTLSLDTNWKLGLVSRNGKGKTTFLNLLQNKYNYRGSIKSDTHFEYFPYDIKNKNYPVGEAIAEHFDNIEMWKLAKELNLIGLGEDYLYRNFDTLSQGEQTKVLLSALFAKENQFLLIDEPTNHLDMNGRKIIADYLNTKKGFILVSHDKYILDKCINHIMSINKTDISLEQGNFSSFMQNKTYNEMFEKTQNEKLIKEIDSLRKSAKRTADWSDKVEKSKMTIKAEGHRFTGRADKGYVGKQAARLMKTSKVFEKRIERNIKEKESLLKNVEMELPLKFRPQKFHKEVLISADNLVMSYGDKAVNQPLTFTVNRGDRFHLKGINGAGKSSLIKLILGSDEVKILSGKLSVASGLKISYVNQSTANLAGLLKDYIKSLGVVESDFRSMLHKLDFKETAFDTRIENFSDGQKKKLLIAKSLVEEAHLYIWDEPLNYIDIYTRMQIKDAILLSEPTMLYVEHDIDFNDELGAKVLDVKSA